MTYDDLPYRFRGWAMKKGVADDAALALWQSTEAKRIMEFVVGEVLREMESSSSWESFCAVNLCLHRIRGKGVEYV